MLEKEKQEYGWMKNILLPVLIASILLPAIALAGPNSYYVTQNGAGSRNGENLSNAWSVKDFNSSVNWSKTDDSKKIDPGDTVYFSGKITTKLTPAGSGSKDGGFITMDGYEQGRQNPVKNGKNAGSASIDLYKDKSEQNYAVWIENRDYLIIQDFEITDCACGVYVRGKSGDSSETSDHIIIRRNYIHETYSSAIQITKYNGGGSTYITVGGAYGDGNYFYDTCQSTNTHNVGFNATDNAVFSYNKIENPLGDKGEYVKYLSQNGLSIHTCANTLVEYNEISGARGQGGIAPKENGNYNTIIRYNKIYNCKLRQSTGGSLGTGIALTSSVPIHDMFIYGNEIYDNGDGIVIIRGAHHIYIWNNIIRDNNGRGIIVSSASVKDSDKHDIFIYSNIIAANGDNAKNTNTGLAVLNASSGDDVQSIKIKNNIFLNNRPGSINYNQLYVGSNQTKYVSLNSNKYFAIDRVPTIYWNGKFETLSAMRTLVPAQEDDLPAAEQIFTIDSKLSTKDAISLILEKEKLFKNFEYSEVLPTLTINGNTTQLSFKNSLDQVKTNSGPETIILWAFGDLNGRIFPPSGVKVN